MARIRQTGTKPEIALRKELHKRGLRYRVNFEVLHKPRRVADIAFTSLSIAVFVDGCFWHGCPLHATWPKQNAEFWRKKIAANQLRDDDTNHRLRELGWTTIRIWSHETVHEAALRVLSAVYESRQRLASLTAHTAIRSP
jgi:DNA mismatch endonuclease (patch repair protein)